ncbi:MAG TPA: hypothetical protein VGH54_09445 [Mycobacterium sp.]|jgi:DNA-directed RNA polymerase specialized sigma subunit|uniref:hypothetical protein n=1 Tax=Mycobacterium sp. TaxID=1785 RepID=UPI002F417DEC
MSTYHANVERDGKFWLIHVPEVDRVTQARHVREIERMARDLVATMEDVEPGSFDLEVSIDLPKYAQDHLKASRAYRHEALEANRRSAEEARIAARSLAEDLPLRDVAELLGVSHQRVHQLVNS